MTIIRLTVISTGVFASSARLVQYHSKDPMGAACGRLSQFDKRRYALCEALTAAPTASDAAQPKTQRLADLPCRLDLPQTGCCQVVVDLPSHHIRKEMTVASTGTVQCVRRQPAPIDKPSRLTLAHDQEQSPGERL